MRYLSLPNITLPISCLTLGAGGLSPENYQRVAELLDAFLELGGTSIDTAHIYGAGGSERALGRWLSDRHNRERVVIITKGCHPIPADSPRPRVRPEALHADLTESLERLQTDSVDLYLLHRDDERMPVGPMIEALNEEWTRGRLRAFGVSNWRSGRIAAANAYALEHHLAGFVASSPCFNLMRPNGTTWPGCVFADDAERAWHTATQFPLLAWSPQAGGFLTGRYGPEDRRNADMARIYFSDQNFERLRRATELGQQKGNSPIQIGLAYVLNQPFPTAAIIGPSTVAHLRDSHAALAIELAAGETGYLDLAQ